MCCGKSSHGWTASSALSAVRNHQVFRVELLLDSSNLVQGLGEPVVAREGRGLFEVYEFGEPFLALGVADQRGNDAFIDPALGIRVWLGAAQVLGNSTCSRELSRSDRRRAEEASEAAGGSSCPPTTVQSWR